MKQLLAFSFALISIHSIAQTENSELPMDPSTNKVTYSDVVDAPGRSKKDLCSSVKKWVTTKNSEINQCSLSIDNPEEGTEIGKGTFQLPGDRRKYIVKFDFKINCKDNKFKYECTNLVIQFKTQAGSSGGGYGYWGGSSYHEAELLEYSIETFYPSRLHGRKPVIKWYDEIYDDAFKAVSKEVQLITTSLKMSLIKKDDW